MDWKNLLTKTPYLVLFIVLISIGIDQDIFAQSEIVIEGRFNVLEIIYENKTISYEYFISTQEEDKIKYTILDFEKTVSYLHELAGKYVRVTAHQKPDSLAPASISNLEKLEVISIIPLKDDKKNLTEEIAAAEMAPASLNSATLLNKFFNDTTEPHTKTYFENRFYSDPDSLAAYWADVSYDQFIFTGSVNGWLELPKTKSEYGVGGFSFHESVMKDIIPLHDPFVDFTNVELLLLVYNDHMPCGCAMATFFSQPVLTEEGVKDLLILHLPDTGDGFAVGLLSQNGIGTPAHEVGHTLGLFHNALPPPSTGFN